MKKIVTFIFLVATAVVFIYSQRKSDVASQNMDNGLSSSPVEKHLTNNPKKNPTNHKRNKSDSYKNDSDKNNQTIKTALKERDLKSMNRHDFFKLASKTFKDHLKCIKDESCLNNGQNDRFYDKSRDPAFVKLRNSLELMHLLAMEDESFLNEISDDQLIEVLTLPHKQSKVLATNILLNKGQESFYKGMKYFKSYTGTEAAEFLYYSSTGQLLENNAIRQRRNELLNHYISSDDKHTVSEVLEKLNHVEMDKSEAKRALTSVCNKYGNDQSESGKIIKFRANKVARNYNLKKCDN